MNILPSDNHLTWLKDYCTREQSGPKIISLNIQMSTNVTFRNAVQQTAIKQPPPRPSRITVESQSSPRRAPDESTVESTVESHYLQRV